MRRFAGLVVVLGLFMGPALAEEAPQSEIEAAAKPKAAAGVQFVDGKGKALGELVKTVKFTGEIRERAEFVDNLVDYDGDFDDSAEFVNSRVRLGFGFEFVQGISALIELQTVEHWGDDGTWAANAGEESDVEIYQAWMQIDTVMPFSGAGGADIPLVIKIGRQEVTLADEMLLGDDDRYDGTTLDAVLLSTETGTGWDLHVLAGRLEEADMWDASTDLDRDTTNRYVAGTLTGEEADNDVYAAFFTYTGIVDWTFNGYLITLDVNDTVAVAEELRHTMGGRAASHYAFNEQSIIDYKAEVAFQFGDTGATGDISAFAAEAELGWIPNKGQDWETRFSAGINYASGDDDAADDDDERFNPLLCDVSQRLGKADHMELSNVMAWYIQAVSRPVKHIELGATILMADAVEEEDVMAAGMADADLTAEDDGLLSEVDLWAKYEVSENLALDGGVAIVMPDDYIVGAGEDDTAYRLWFEAQLKW